MNTSNSTLTASDGDDIDRNFLHKLNVIQGSIYIPIFCAGIANNLLTILIIALNRDMRTVTNCYLLNLAISDTLPLIVSLPFEIPVSVQPLRRARTRVLSFYSLVSSDQSSLGWSGLSTSGIACRNVDECLDIDDQVCKFSDSDVNLFGVIAALSPSNGI